MNYKLLGVSALKPSKNSGYPATIWESLAWVCPDYGNVTKSHTPDVTTHAKPDEFLEIFQQENV